MKEFCRVLKKHVTRIISYEKKEMIPLTKKEEKVHNKQRECYIFKESFIIDDNNKKNRKVRDQCHYTGN